MIHDNGPSDSESGRDSEGNATPTPQRRLSLTERVFGEDGARALRAQRRSMRPLDLSPTPEHRAELKARMRADREYQRLRAVVRESLVELIQQVLSDELPGALDVLLPKKGGRRRG